MALTHADAVPWHAAYPPPREAQPGSLAREQVLEMLKNGGAGVPDRDFLLIDLRRNDHEGGTIRGSINLPAQSLYLSVPTLYTMFKRLHEMRSVVLREGIKGWATAGREYTEWMDEYDASKWAQ